MASNRYADVIIVAWLREHKIPPPEVEYEYAKPRRFRADYAWVEQRLLLEVEGGIYTRQAHGSISGILNDIERSQQAAMNGYRVFKVQPDDLLRTDTARMIQVALEWKPPDPEPKERGK